MKKVYTVEERVQYYTDKLADLETAQYITTQIFERQKEFIVKRIEALSAEKTKTKESDRSLFKNRIKKKVG